MGPSARHTPLCPAGHLPLKGGDRSVARDRPDRGLAAHGKQAMPLFLRLTPLCPAGHLPLKEGDRLGAAARSTGCEVIPPTACRCLLRNAYPPAAGTICSSRYARARQEGGASSCPIPTSAAGCSERVHPADLPPQGGRCPAGQRGGRKGIATPHAAVPPKQWCNAKRMRHAMTTIHTGERVTSGT
ncbi:hypothetical protein J2Z17_002226 [Rhizobium halophytocola]|uniref:Lytic murein transglycosylase n=1 Tax=Rhizobium halophytocola TaxID=735519 RepID=A0ABS4DYR5_9HYPH|nr:hypothetical protein [Rhizobium halophytocola]